MIQKSKFGDFLNLKSIKNTFFSWKWTKQFLGKSIPSWGKKISWNIRGWFFWLFVNFFLFSVLLLLFNPSPTLILFSSKLRKVLEQKVVFKFSFRLFVRLFVCLLAQTYSEIILHDAVVLALPVCISSRRRRLRIVFVRLYVCTSVCLFVGFVSIIQLRLKLKLCCRRGTWTNN